MNYKTLMLIVLSSVLISLSFSPAFATINNLHIHYEFANGTNYNEGGKMLNTNASSSTGTWYTLNSTGWTPTFHDTQGVPQNYTMKDNDNYVLWKDWNISPSGSGTRIDRILNDYSVSCPNHSGVSVEVKINNTDGHRGTFSSTPTCNTNDIISPNMTFTSAGKSGAIFSTTLLIKVKDLVDYGYNALWLSVNSNPVATTYSTPIILSSSFTVGSGEATYSKNLSFRLGAIPPTPTLTNVTAINATELKLTWTSPTGNLTGFKIERSWDNFANSTWTSLVNNTNTPQTLSYTFYHLIPNIQYNYRVSGVNTIGISPPSNVIGVTTPTVKFDGTHSFITFAFDHGFLNQQNATHWMKQKYGFAGTMWIPTNRTGVNQNLLSWYNVTRYFSENNGWEIVPHSRNHLLKPYSEFGNGTAGSGMPNSTAYGGYGLYTLQKEITGSFIDMQNIALHPLFNYSNVCGYVAPSLWHNNGTVDTIITGHAGNSYGQAIWTATDILNQYTNTTEISNTNNTPSIGMAVMYGADIGDVGSFVSGIKKGNIADYKNVVGNITATYPNACYHGTTNGKVDNSKTVCNNGHAQWIILHVHDILNGTTTSHGAGSLQGYEVPVSSTLFDKTMAYISSAVSNGTLIYENPSAGLGVLPRNGLPCK